MSPIALTIAGSDPSGGAGLQADLKTFHAHSVYGASVVSLLTVQNTRGVRRVEVLDAALVREQLECVLDDLDVRAVKTGALGSADVVDVVVDVLSRTNLHLVVDPVMVSKHGAPLVDETATNAIRRTLLPRAYLITPNAPEAEVLAGLSVHDVASARAAALAIRALGATHVLVKGGHLEGERSVDVLLVDDVFVELDAPRITTTAGHGTGCTLSAAITARLARGESLVDAVTRSKHWVARALTEAARIGHGTGPVNHFVPVDE